MPLLCAGRLAALVPALAAGLLLVVPIGARAQSPRPQGRQAIAPQMPPQTTPVLPPGSLPGMTSFLMPVIGHRQRVVWAIEEVLFLMAQAQQLGIYVPALDNALQLLVNDLIWSTFRHWHPRPMGFASGLAGVGWWWGKQVGARPWQQWWSPVQMPGGLVGQPMPVVLGTRRLTRMMASAQPGGLVGLRAKTRIPERMVRAALSRERGQGQVGEAKVDGAGAKSGLVATGRGASRGLEVVPSGPTFTGRPSGVSFLKGSGRVGPVMKPPRPRPRH
jgi:hypothetical protein